VEAAEGLDLPPSSNRKKRKATRKIKVHLRYGDWLLLELIKLNLTPVDFASFIKTLARTSNSSIQIYGIGPLGASQPLTQKQKQNQEQQIQTAPPPPMGFINFDVHEVQICPNPKPPPPPPMPPQRKKTKEVKLKKGEDENWDNECT
jgi:hypothetical protein